MKRLLAISLALLITFSAMALAQGQIFKQSGNSYVMHIHPNQLPMDPIHPNIHFANNVLHATQNFDADLALRLPVGAVIKRITVLAGYCDEELPIEAAVLRFELRSVDKNDPTISIPIVSQEHRGLIGGIQDAFVLDEFTTRTSYRLTKSSNLNSWNILRLSGTALRISTVKVHFNYKGTEKITGF